MRDELGLARMGGVQRGPRGKLCLGRTPRKCPTVGTGIFFLNLCRPGPGARGRPDPQNDSDEPDALPVLARARSRGQALRARDDSARDDSES